MVGKLGGSWWLKFLVYDRDIEFEWNIMILFDYLEMISWEL